MPSASQDLFAGQQVLHVAVAPQRDSVYRVLQQKAELVANGAKPSAICYQLPLPLEGAPTSHAPGLMPLAAKH